MTEENQVGFLDLSQEGRDGDRAPRGYLAVNNVFLSEEYRRKGIGRLLYREALKLAKKKGFRGLASEVNSRNVISDKIWSQLAQGTIGNWEIAENV